MIEPIFRIENEKEEVTDIKINGVFFWPYLRTSIRFLILNRGNPRNGSIKRWLVSVYFFLRDCVHQLVWIFTCFNEILILFKKYDLVIFSNDLEIKKTADGVFIDKLISGMKEKLKDGKFLVIHYGNGEAYKKITKNIINGRFIDFLSKVQFSSPKSISDKHISLLKDICSDESIHYNSVISDVDRFLKKKKVLLKYLKIWKPKSVMVECYSYYPELYAANELNIYTTEIQHGIICSAHPGYNYGFGYNKMFRARQILLFGKEFERLLLSQIGGYERMEVVGNFYLELIEKSAYNHQLMWEIKKYEKSICIPIDDYTANHIIHFIQPVIDRLPNVLFVFSLRASLSEQFLIKLRYKNVEVVEDIPFQIMIQWCDIYAASFSTCAFEAAYFRKKCLLINDNGEAFRYFKEFEISSYFYYCNTQNEFITSVCEFNGQNQNVPENIINHIYAKNYSENIEKITFN